jgi:CelD/BcsL family acetyltransferase involved in cellulose biosynthesis
MTVRVEELDGPEAMEALTPEWEALDRTLSPRTPFTAPLWNILWWKHFRADQVSVRDEFFAHAVRGPDGALVAVAPMMLTYRPAVGPMRARALQFFGTDPNMTEIRGLVCHPSNERRVVRALVDHFVIRGDEWDWLDWGGIREAETVRWFLHVSDLGSVRHIPDYYLRLPGSWEDLRASLSRNVKESLRKCYNSLKRDGHTFTFHAHAQPEQVAPAVDRFLSLHARRAEAVGTIEHKDVFRASRARTFLAEYSQRMAERDQLRLFELEIGGQVVAARMGMILGDELYLYYSGYDLAWSKYSVMTTLVAEAIKWAIGAGLKVVNLSTGTDVSKTRWSPREVVYSGGLRPSPTRRGRLAFAAYHTLLHHYRRHAHLKKFLTIARRAE